tara:strand:+ start:653 stop:2821 length:2169 start_codon:yes stop_codon:yes gene_type:complete
MALTLEELEKARNANLKLNQFEQARASNVQQTENIIEDQDINVIAGVGREIAEGFTLGHSGEIAGALAGVGSIFTDETFNEAFDRRIGVARDRSKRFSKAYPKTAIASNIVGGIAPVVASAIATGGAGAGATGSALTAKILSNPLLAGKIAKQSSGLLGKIGQGAKIGSIQGGVAGAGYTEGDLADKAIGAAIGLGAGGLLGATTPAVLSGLGKGYSAVARKFKPKSFDEDKTLRTIANQFSRDEISADQAIKNIQTNISADRLAGTNPVEILADYGGESVVRKLRGVRTRVPDLNIDKQLLARTTGLTEQKASALIDDTLPDIQSTRIAESLEDTAKQTLKTKGINLQSGVDDIVEATEKKLSPLYRKAFTENNTVSNLELYKYLQKPLIRDAYGEAKNAYIKKLEAEGRPRVAIPSLSTLFVRKKGKGIVGVKKELPLEFLDMIKREADTITYRKGVREGTISPSTMRVNRTLAKNFRDLLKQSVKGSEYNTALKKGANKFALTEAFEKGTKYTKPSSITEFEKQFNTLKTNAEKDAFRVGTFQQILKEIETVGDNIDLVKRIFEKPALRKKIAVMFTGNPKARDQFVNKLVRESNINRNVQKVVGGSPTADKAFDANELMNAMENIAIMANQPTSSAGFRAGGSLSMKAKDLLSNPLEQRSKEIGELLLERNPNRQLEMLELIKELQRKQAIANSRIGYGSQGLVRGAIPATGSYLGQN